MDFYANKYKIRKMSSTTDKEDFIPSGTVFTVNSMNFNVVELKPVSKISDVPFLPVEVNLLNFGFTLTEHVTAPD